MIYSGIGLAVVIVVGIAALLATRGRPGLVEVEGSTTGQRQSVDAAASGPRAATGPTPVPRGVVERYPEQGTAHIRLGDPPPAYNSNPPTSGWHTPQDAPWGSHRTVIPDEVLVHNLEHGGIWISYRDGDDGALVERLEALASRYRSKVIVTPRPANDVPIAVAAWTRLMKLDAYEEEKIVGFINAYKNRGPERVPD
ncbi:MAG: DUF3105 domain-containing protein [Armatimonadota bacterium]|nr:DUF3105 domain-containing protein [Armatimonadota bacterium]MDR7543375.1 DUF3105 domain-containing protein [Armatimonadota bacterium]